MTETKADYQTPSREPEAMSEARLDEIQKWYGRVRFSVYDAPIELFGELLAEVRRLLGKEHAADALVDILKTANIVHDYDCQGSVHRGTCQCWLMPVSEIIADYLKEAQP